MGVNELEVNNINEVSEFVNNDFESNVSESGISESSISESSISDVNIEETDNEISMYNNDFQVNLSLEEKIKCLEEILGKIKKILYVYDKSQEPNSNYNYKVYCGGVLIYVSSSNILFNGELVNIVVNMNAILYNNFNKIQLKRIVFETRNFTEFLLSKYIKELKNSGKSIDQY